MEKACDSAKSPDQWPVKINLRERRHTDMQSLSQTISSQVTKSPIVATKQDFVRNESPETYRQNDAPDATPVHARSACAGGGSGLVHSRTSDTPSERIVLNPEKSRLKRLKSSVITAARLHAESRSKWRVLMITPTYAPGSAWNPRDITNLSKCIRQHLSRRGIEFRYVWVMEYTKKGFPHYHMLVWLPYGVTLPFADKQGWWTKGWTNQEWARNAVGYIAKYASKGTECARIEGARHHGNGGMTGAALLEQRWW